MTCSTSLTHLYMPSIIIHGASCRDLELSNDDCAYHISICGLSRYCGLMSKPILLASFARQLFTTPMLSPAFLRCYLSKHGYLMEAASVSVARSTSFCSHLFPSTLANHLSIIKIRWPRFRFQVAGTYNLDTNSIHFQFYILWEVSWPKLITRLENNTFFEILFEILEASN